MLINFVQNVNAEQILNNNNNTSRLKKLKNKNFLKNKSILMIYIKLLKM